MEVKELKEVIDKAFKINTEIKRLDAEKKGLNGTLDTLKKKILNHLEENELDSFSTQLCMVYPVTKESVKFPKEASDKRKVFKYIKNKYGDDALYGYLTINSATFNTFYNKEAELSFEKENNLNFSIEGVSEPVGYTTLNIRKK